MKIPQISEETLATLLARIRPLIIQDGVLMNIKLPDPRKVAFTWSPVVTDPANGIVEIARIRTLHTFGYPGFFKPSVAEVIAQIPERWIDRTVAFSTRGPEDAEEMNREREALDAGFHVAETTLYGLNT